MKRHDYSRYNLIKRVMCINFSSPNPLVKGVTFFLVRYLNNFQCHFALPIFLDYWESSIWDMKQEIIGSYSWRCGNEGCKNKCICSFKPTAQDIYLEWWNSENGRDVRYICPSSHVVRPSSLEWFHGELVFYVSDNTKIFHYLNESTVSTVVSFSVVRKALENHESRIVHVGEAGTSMRKVQGREKGVPKEAI